MFVKIMIFTHSLMDENDPIGLLFCMMLLIKSLISFLFYFVEFY